MKRYALALDLIDDPQKIREYEEWHTRVWPEIIESIKSAGIGQMEIYRAGNRLFMIMETSDSFTFAEKQTRDTNNPAVQKWEELMWNFQQALPFAKPGEKWVVMQKIFSLS